MNKRDQFNTGLALLIFLITFSPILNENTIEAEKRGPQRYMVYIIRIEKKATEPREWLCGGVIISKSHILTAGACLIEVDQLYAVGEYNKHINPDDMDVDPCTKNRKKLIVKCILPKSFYTTNEGWNNHDLGVGVLDTPYDFTEQAYSDCSYAPIPIEVNYDPQLENINTDVLAFGWGHTDRDRNPHELIQNNEETLRGEYLQIVNTEQCAKKVNVETDHDVIDLTHTICTMTRTCDGALSDLGGPQDPNCYEEEYETNRRNNGNNSQDTLTGIENTTIAVTFLKPYRGNQTRRQDVCQNDHGGPLVTWINNKPVVIGVASTNTYVKGFNCIPPNIFESTAKNEWFIKCVTAEDADTLKFCQQLKNKINSGTEQQSSERGDKGVTKTRQQSFFIPDTSQYMNYQQAAPMTYQVVQNNAPLIHANIPIIQNVPLIPNQNSVPIFYQNYLIESIAGNGGQHFKSKPDGSFNKDIAPSMNLQIILYQNNVKLTTKPTAKPVVTKKRPVKTVTSTKTLPRLIKARTSKSTISKSSIVTKITTPLTTPTTPTTKTTPTMMISSDQNDMTTLTMRVDDVIDKTL